MVADIPVDKHLFTSHTNPRLTFVVGVVLGISLMTMGGVAFVLYALSGANVVSFDVKPLDTTNNILEEPRINVVLSDTQSITVDDSTHMYGAIDDYKLTVVEYIDYECRFCKKFHPNVVALVDAHPDSLRLIVKHYPLTQIHPNAKAAAIAAECAGEQGKFFEYSASLFEKQTNLSNDVYQEIATNHNLDTTAFTQCIEAASAASDTSVISKIEADVTEALQLGVQSQPNLVLWDGTDTIEIIDGYVDSAYLESSVASSVDAQ